MPAKYQKFGLRRDRNLSDLTSPNAALANLLDQTITVTATNTFIPNDLTSAIDGLRDTTLTVEDIQKVKGTVRTYTSAGATVPFEPLQTVEDNIRNFKTYLGTPPFSGGGDGIKALFVPWAAMDGTWDALTSTQKRDAQAAGPLDISPQTIDMYDTTYVAPNKVQPGLEGPFDYWDNGIFLLGTKVFDGVKGKPFTDTYGMIVWEGFVQGGQRFDMEYTGLLKIEVDPQNTDSWTFIKNIYDEDRGNINLTSATYDAGTDVSTILLTTPSDHIYFSIGDVMNIGDDDEYIVTEINTSAGTFTVSGDATTNVDPANPANNVPNTFPINATFEHEIGETQICRTGPDCTVPNAGIGGLVHLRITLWWPNYGDGRRFTEKRFSDFNEDATDRIPYSNFYSSIPTGNPGIYTYEYFDQNRLSKRNKFISPRNSTGITVSATTSGGSTINISPTPLETAKLLYANYTPPTVIGDKYKDGNEVFHQGGGKFVSVGTNISVSTGDWVVIEGSTGGTGNNRAVFAVTGTSTDIDGVVEFYVDEDEINGYFTSITITNYQNGTNQYAHVWRPEGLIGFLRLESTATANEFDIVNMNGQILSQDVMTVDVRDNYMIAGVGTGIVPSPFSIPGPAGQFTHFKRVDKTSTSQIDTEQFYLGDSYTPTTGAGTIWVAGVYSHTGLQDLSSEDVCEGTVGLEVVSQPAANQLTFQAVSGIATGYYAQFGSTDTVTYTSAFIPNGTTVTNISGTTLTFSSNVSAPPNSTVVFIATNPNGAAKEFCVLPLNTAPPFIGTDAGLRTTSNGGISGYLDGTDTEYPNLITEGLIFGELELRDVVLNTATYPTGNKLDLTANPTYSKTLDIRHVTGYDSNDAPVFTTYKFLVA